MKSGTSQTGINSFNRWSRSLFSVLHRWLVSNQDLKVWQRSDRKGNRYWQAYNPTTGRSISAGSEDEIRAWIEQQYGH